MATTPESRETTKPAPSSVPLPVTSTGLSELLALSPDALLIVDQAGTIVMANEQAAALFGYSREELHQLRLEMLLPATPARSPPHAPRALFRRAAHALDGRRTPAVGTAQGWSGVSGGYQPAPRAAG